MAAPKLNRAWICDVSPTLRAVLCDRGSITLTRHGQTTTTIDPAEARKLIDAWQTTRRETSA